MQVDFCPCRYRMLFWVTFPSAATISDSWPLLLLDTALLGVYSSTLVPLSDNGVRLSKDLSICCLGVFSALQGSASPWLPVQAGYCLEKVLYWPCMCSLRALLGLGGYQTLAGRLFWCLLGGSRGVTGRAVLCACLRFYLWAPATVGFF